jgi:hypothetical protein
MFMYMRSYEPHEPMSRMSVGALRWRGVSTTFVGAAEKRYGAAAHTLP